MKVNKGLFCVCRQFARDVRDFAVRKGGVEVDNPYYRQSIHRQVKSGKITYDIRLNLADNSVRCIRIPTISEIFAKIKENELCVRNGYYNGSSPKMIKGGLCAFLEQCR